MYPLNNFTCTLSESIPIGIRARNTVELEYRGYPSERTGRLGDAVMDFDVGVFCVDAGVEVVVCRD